MRHKIFLAIVAAVVMGLIVPDFVSSDRGRSGRRGWPWWGRRRGGGGGGRRRRCGTHGAVAVVHGRRCRGQQVRLDREADTRWLNDRKHDRRA